MSRAKSRYWVAGIKRGLFSVFYVPMVSVLCAVVVEAGPYDAPTNYYNSATGTGSSLKSQLHNIIDGHTVRSYNAARSLLQITDQDPSDPDRMILVYDRISLDVSSINPNGSIPGWDNAATWNREHTWPRSRGVDSSGPDNSDLHQLRPSTTQVNSDRGNLNFGGAFGAQSFGTVFDGGLKWYPGDADAGMIARQQFYMATRYDNSDSATDDLELVNGNPGTNGTTMGDLSRLIEWHYAAPPQEFELRRNDVIYDDYQGNRNPYIDRPEFVWSVFVDQQNDSQIALAGTTPSSGGSSTLQLDLGRVLVGASVPATQSVTLSKSGNDGTYYRVSTSGHASSTRVDTYNAFRTGGSDTSTIDVGLNTSTVLAGQRTGMVTIDNLDVTTGGGVGRGANDADDAIEITLDVLDHANPSFAFGDDIDSFTHDFGAVTLGSTMPTFDFSVFNLESTTGFTAGLELDQILAGGDSAALTTDLDLFGGDSMLDAGEGLAFSAAFDTSIVGDFLATYTLSFSDEDVPGATDLESLEITLMGTIEAAADSADFDTDGDIDGGDYLTWQRGFAIGASLSEGDANGDASVDAADLSIWQQQFAAASAVGGVHAVPEPASLAMLFVSTALIAVRRGVFIVCV